MNGRLYGRSSQSFPKILGNLQQSLHPAPPPATPTSLPLLTTASSLLPASPPHTLISEPLTTSTTLPPASQLLPPSPRLHPSSSKNNHVPERQKNPLAPLLQPLPQPPQPPAPSPLPPPPSSPNSRVQKRQKYPLKSPSQGDAQPH